MDTVGVQRFRIHPASLGCSRINLRYATLQLAASEWAASESLFPRSNCLLARDQEFSSPDLRTSTVRNDDRPPLSDDVDRTVSTRCRRANLVRKRFDQLQTYVLVPHLGLRGIKLLLCGHDPGHFVSPVSGSCEEDF